MVIAWIGEVVVRGSRVALYVVIACLVLEVISRVRRR